MGKISFDAKLFVEEKTSLELSNGILDYKDKIIYLGVLFSDMGKISFDAKLFVEEKTSLELSNGILDYKDKIIYLGVLFSDMGKISFDAKLFVEEKRCNVTVNFSNFCAKNYLAPLQVKLSVLHSCVMSSLTYSCETWADVLPQEIESIFRMGLKTDCIVN